MEPLKTWTLNFLFIGWSAAVFSECISFTVGIVAGVSLIWFNIERALKTRKERRNK